jgi:hypothetical protein
VSRRGRRCRSVARVHPGPTFRGARAMSDVLHAATCNVLSAPVANIEDACRAVAQHYHGALGVWVYQAFEWINAMLFFDELPYPLIVLGLTAHGKCLAWTRSPLAELKPPTILLHPSLWGGTERVDPWKIPADLLGPRYALDVLIHESMHVSVAYRLGYAPTRRESSHNNPAWIAEVNRIAPLIGLPGVQAAMSIPKRVGKKVQRMCDGNIPFSAAASFPHPVRRLRGELDYYRDRSPLPFERNAQLGVTEPAGLRRSQGEHLRFRPAALRRCATDRSRART